MSSYHCTAKVVSRGKGQSVVAKAAYNARDALKNERVNETCDYRRAHFSEVLFSGIFAPKDAPAWVFDREQLWNRVDSAEDRLNRKASCAQTAREIEFSLPHELTDQQREWLVKNFVKEQFTRQGMIADVNIHAPDQHGDDRNYHAHVLLTMRRLDGDDFSKDKADEWNKTPLLEQWKDALAIEGAKMLARAGFEVEAERFRWGHKQQEEQYAKAIERGDFEYAELKSREPTTHRGPHLQVVAEPDRTLETMRNVRAANDADLSEKDTLYAELAAVENEIAAEREHQEKTGAKVVDLDGARCPIEASASQANDNQLTPSVQAERDYDSYLTAQRDARQWEDQLTVAAIKGARREELRQEWKQQWVTERFSNPDLKGTTIETLREAWEQSERDPLRFRENLEAQGLWLARASEADHAQSVVEASHAIHNSKFGSEYAAGEIVAVNTLGYVYKFGLGTIGEFSEDVGSLFAPLDAVKLADIAETRAEFRPERGPILSDPTLPTAADTLGLTARDGADVATGAFGQAFSAIGEGFVMLVKPVEKVAEILAEAVDRIADIGGASKPTKEQVLARVDAREEKKEAAAIDFSRYMKDEDYRRQLAEREAREAADRDAREREDRDKRECGRDR